MPRNRSPISTCTAPTARQTECTLGVPRGDALCERFPKRPPIGCRLSAHSECHVATHFVNVFQKDHTPAAPECSPECHVATHFVNVFQKDHTPAVPECSPECHVARRGQGHWTTNSTPLNLVRTCHGAITAIAAIAPPATPARGHWHRARRPRRSRQWYGDEPHEIKQAPRSRAAMVEEVASDNRSVHGDLHQHHS